MHRALFTFVAVSLLPSACGDGDVVRLPDCIDCRPVEMAVANTLEVELGSDRSVTDDPEAYTWAVTDMGTMELVSEERGTRPEGDEFIGGYSRFVTYAFEPTEVGTTQMRFEFLPSDDAEGRPGNTIEVTVIVGE